MFLESGVIYNEGMNSGNFTMEWFSDSDCGNRFRVNETGG